MTRKELRLPHAKIRDATHTATLRMGYRNKLIGLYERFDEQLKPSLQRMLDRNIVRIFREFADVKPGFTKDFSERLNSIADYTIYAGAPKIINEHITLGYRAGKQRAVSNPRIIKSIRIDPKLSIYDNRVIEDLKARNFSLITKLTEDMKTDLLRVMTDGIKHGDGTTKIAKDISESITTISRSRAETIARTEIAYSYNTAISETYKKADITQWQWLATLGTTCCEECAALHGQVFDWTDEQPPLHPNCLCTIYPVVEMPGEMT